MDTRIFIRAKVNDKWDSYDIGDPKLPDSEVVSWLTSKYQDTGHKYLMRLVMLLLNRDQSSII